MTSTTSPEDLRRADQLEAEGHLLEAVDVLTAVNRRARSADLDRRLVDLRHRAFTVLDEPGLPSWPRDPVDVFADAGAAPPEIEMRDLDARAIASGVVRHGSLIVRGLVAGAQLERLQDDVMRAFAARDALRSGESPGVNGPWYEPYAVGRKKAEGFGADAFVRTVDSPPTLFDLVETYRDIGLHAKIAEHLGERPAVSANKSALRRIVVTEASLPDGMYHQDGAFLGTGIRALNVWLTLSDCGGEADSPGLDIVPKRLPEVLPTGTEGSVFPWTVSRDLVAEVSVDDPVVRPTFRAGDALLFDELLLHSTGIDMDMRSPRYAIECWFFAPSVYPEKHFPVVF